MKKVLKGNHFADVEEVTKKMAEALKGVIINEVKNCLEQWKKGEFHQMDSILKVTEV